MPLIKETRPVSQIDAFGGVDLVGEIKLSIFDKIATIFSRLFSFLASLFTRKPKPLTERQVTVEKRKNSTLI